MAQRDLLSRSTVLNSKRSPAPSDCAVRSFIFMAAVKDCEMRCREEKAEAGNIVKNCKVLFKSTNNVGVSVMLETCPSLKIMTWAHLPVKENKSTASSGCYFYYQFLASRRVYKTAPYCIS